MELFLPTYFLLYANCALLAFPLVIHADTSRRYHYIVDTSLLWLVSIATIILFGSRDYDVGTDTQRYAIGYGYLINTTSIQEALISPYISRDPFFNLMGYALSRFIGITAYFFVLAALFITPITLTIQIFTKKNRLLLLLGVLSLFIIPNLGINVIRSGISLAFALLAFVTLNKGKRKQGIVLAIFSVLFHAATLIVFIAFFMARLIKFRFFLYAILLICAGLGLVGIGIRDLPIVGGILQDVDRLANLIDQDLEAARLPISTFLALISIISYFEFFACRFKEEDYIIWGKTFILLVSCYFLSSTLFYGYRIGMLAWIFSPFVLAYPLLYYKVTKRTQSLTLWGIFILLAIFSLYQLKQFI